MFLHQEGKFSILKKYSKLNQFEHGYQYHLEKIYIENGFSFRGDDSYWDIISRDLKSPIHMLDIHIVDSHSDSKTYN